jgi:hypothetical protein
MPNSGELSLGLDVSGTMAATQLAPLGNWRGFLCMGEVRLKIMSVFCYTWLSINIAEIDAPGFRS